MIAVLPLVIHSSFSLLGSTLVVPYFDAKILASNNLSYYHHFVPSAVILPTLAWKKLQKLWRQKTSLVLFLPHSFL